MEVHEGKTAGHRNAKALVIRVARIGTSIAVAKQSIRTEGVVIRAGRSGCNRQGCLSKDFGLEDPSGAHQRNADSSPKKALSEERPWEDVSDTVDLIPQPLKGGATDSRVLGIKHDNAAASAC
jgi:hypothetical protein